MTDRTTPRHDSRREDDKWWRKNSAVIAIVLGMLGQAAILVETLTTLKNNDIEINKRQDRTDAANQEWQRARSVLPERVTRLEVSVQNVTENVQNLVSELREDRRADKRQKKERGW